jgi:hypothetical protein
VRIIKKNMNEVTANTKEMTAGEIAVGLTFNPSGDERVDKLKLLFAEAFDIVEQSVPADDGTIPTARKRKLRDAALHEILSAQMWAVKVITLK